MSNNWSLSPCVPVSRATRSEIASKYNLDNLSTGKYLVIKVNKRRWKQIDICWDKSCVQEPVQVRGCNSGNIFKINSMYDFVRCPIFCIYFILFIQRCTTCIAYISNCKSRRMHAGTGFGGSKLIKEWYSLH